MPDRPSDPVVRRIELVGAVREAKPTLTVGTMTVGAHA
jgi:hypothetical protein